MRERKVEAASARIASERTHASGHRACLPDRTCPAVRRPHDLMGDAVKRQELDGLGVLTCRHRDVVPALAQEGDQRPEEGHLRGVRDVDPDPHVRDPIRRVCHEQTKAST